MRNETHEGEGEDNKNGKFIHAIVWLCLGAHKFRFFSLSSCKRSAQQELLQGSACFGRVCERKSMSEVAKRGSSASHSWCEENWFLGSGRDWLD